MHLMLFGRYKYSLLIRVPPYLGHDSHIASLRFPIRALFYAILAVAEM